MSMSMGTKTGAMIAHFADALPMNRLMKDETTTKDTINGSPSNSMALSAFAPVTARMIPRFDQLKNAMKWAATKASTMYAPMLAMVSAVMVAASLSLLMEPVTIP